MKKKILADSLLVTLGCLMIQLLILACRDGGTLHFESCFFLMNYLDGQTLLKQVFDPVRNDWTLYQARELSYFFDALDARFVGALLKHKIVWFHSITSLLLCGLTVFLQQYMARKYFQRIPPLTITAFSLLFVLAPGTTGLVFFRTAKYLTALGLTGLFFSVYSSFRTGSAAARAGIFFSMLLLVLADRQGFFLTAAATVCCAVLLFYQSWQRSALSARRLRFPVWCGSGMVTFGILNNLYITPWLIKLINDYTPAFHYQQNIPFTPASLVNGFLFVTANTGNWFSNYSGSIAPAALTGSMMTGILAAKLFYDFRRGRMIARPLLLLWGMLWGAMVVCAAGMAARHDKIMNVDVLFGTYSITFMSIVWCLLLFTAAGAEKKFQRILLAVLLLGIFLRLGGELAGDKFNPESITVSSGYDSRQPHLRRALRDPGFDTRRVAMPYRMELVINFCRKKLLKNP